MEKINSVKDGVIRLLTLRGNEVPDFNIADADEGELCSMLVMGTERIPMLSHRYEPRMDRIHTYGKSSPKENLAFNVYSFLGKDSSLDSLIYKELDCAEYALCSPIVAVTAFINGDACNLMAECENGALANLELGTTMAVGTVPQFNHRLITKHGMATDRTVNNVVEQNGVYLFSEDDPRAYTFDDGEYYLYGLTVEQSCDATFIRGILLGDLCKDELIAQDLRLRKLVEAVRRSSEIGETVRVGGTT